MWAHRRSDREPARASLKFTTLALAASVLVSGCGAGGADKSAEAEVKPRVEAMLAAPSGAGADLRAAGMVAFQRETPLSFRTPGLIRQILVDEGDTVRAGQVLARLDLLDVNAALAAAETAFRNAEDQFQRNTSLFQRGFISKAGLDASELTLVNARSQLTAARFAREQSVITAPTPGVILRRLAEPNQNVASGSPILVLGSQTEGVIVRAGLSADAVRRVKVGDRAEVRVDAGAFRPGRVVRIAAKSDAATSAFDIEVRLDNAVEVRSGQVAEVLLRTQVSTTPKIRVPVTALFDARADQGFLYVVDAANTARRRAVRTAGLEGELVVIAEGLTPEERIIVSGAAFVRDGQAVDVVMRAAP